METLLSTAEAFAREAHLGQTRKGAAREPYTVHLAEVAGFVSRHGGGQVTQAVAWLHDTVEDCDVTLGEVERNFGTEVAGAVAELTDDKTLPKAERKALQIENAPHKSRRAALVKLGDKWSNIGALAISPPVGWDDAQLRGYVDWGVAVVDALPRLPSAARAEFDATVARTRCAIDKRAVAPAAIG